MLTEHLQAQTLILIGSRQLPGAIGPLRICNIAYFIIQASDILFISFLLSAIKEKCDIREHFEMQ